MPDAEMIRAFAWLLAAAGLFAFLWRISSQKEKPSETLAAIAQPPTYNVEWQPPNLGTPRGQRDPEPLPNKLPDPE